MAFCMPERLHINKKDLRCVQKIADHNGGGEKQIGEKAKDTPGIICIERNVHDDAIVISGTLTVEYGTADLSVWIAEGLEEAAREVKEKEGIVGHIKAAVTVTSTDSVSVTDDKAMVTHAPQKRARIALAAIVFMIEPEAAENIIRKALAGVRARLRAEKQGD